MKKVLTRIWKRIRQPKIKTAVYKLHNSETGAEIYPEFEFYWNGQSLEVKEPPEVDGVYWQNHDSPESAPVGNFPVKDITKETEIIE